MAISGLGAGSLVAPLVLASCIRAIAYRRLLTRIVQHPVRADRFDHAPVGPVLALLKADGRTALLLKLQSAQFVFSVGALCIGGWLTRNVSDQGSAILVIAIASTLQFLVFGSLSVRASLRGRGGEPTAAMLHFLRPLAAAMIPNVLAIYGAETLDEPGSAGRLAACLVLPVGYLALYAIMPYAIDRLGASEVMTVVRATAGRLRQLRL